jgi:hypothetical protein
MSTRHGVALLLLLVACGCGRSTQRVAAPARCLPPDSTVTSAATPIVVPDHARSYSVQVGHRLELVGSSTSEVEVTASVLAVVPPGTSAAVGEGVDPLSGVSTALVSARGTGAAPVRLQFTPTEPGQFPVLMRVDYRCGRSGEVGREPGRGEAEVALVVAH